MTQASDLPETWQSVLVEEIADINPALPINDLPEDLAVSFLPMKAVEEESGHFNASTTKTLREVKKGYTPFVDGDVIFAKITPCMENGKAAVVEKLVNGIGFGSTEFHVLRVRKGGVLPRFLFFYLIQESFRKEAQSNMTGSAGQKRVPPSFMQSACIPIPPVSEQLRIVAKIEELFTKLDAGVETLKKARAQLKRYRQSVLKAAVTGELTREWREAHRGELEPASELLARILRERREEWEADQLAKMKAAGKSQKNDDWKQKYQEPDAPDTSELPELPEGWVWATWEQVGFSQNGRAFPSSEYQDNGVKLLRPGNLHISGKVSWTTENTRHMPEKWAEEFPSFIVGPSELVMNLTAQSLRDEFLGRVCLTGESERCLLNQRIARLTPVLALPSYLLWMFKSEIFRRFVDGLNTGSLIQHMFTSQLAEFALPLPSLAEQKQIVSEVERLFSIADATEQAIEQSLKQAERLRQSILKRAFEGKLVPQDPADEPATLLLARIREGRKARAAAPQKRAVPRPRRRAAANQTGLFEGDAN